MKLNKYRRIKKEGGMKALKETGILNMEKQTVQTVRIGLSHSLSVGKVNNVQDHHAR